MHIQPPSDTMLALTSEWTGERFDDGRPRVSDDVLEELRTATTEAIWTVLWDEGYEHQFEGGWLITHPAKRLVGRAVTAQFLPRRPDLDTIMVTTANDEGRPTRSENQNWLVVESLVEGDVMVVDIFGKIYEGTVIGDQLGTAIDSRTKAGAVIHGGIRDLEGISQLSNINVYYRGTDPTPIRNVTLAGLNIPVRIGGATAMPGDVVLGTPSGVLFIPPHLAERAARLSAETKRRDHFAKTRLSEGVYSTSQIDVEIWAEEIESDYTSWQSAVR
ncbi:RraA family protein [Subtercola boreus]|uniref:Putative 4-hydroxy-4-methyl-2-oxoglutarate aldolase n=1 Tax=Subtercola boreus TaxID=120213 RepID=A0A3E0WE49_9MICO|nr:RraA family protein [Subtercola boreus]RFA23223.1 dimethylmenaquinone methyltransferase [Subtercola boreus]RFA23296.1 dimethylmenaquinone methyltransferase [Subtercola boreus]RFA29099.1 dimethylmenaquinone methyltransferase [Subtercola boreus]